MCEYCRACNQILPDTDILVYENMPKSAQFFPDKSEIDKEKGISIRLRQCNYCGLVQAVGEPVSYYRDVIRASSFSKEMMEFRRQQYSKWVNDNNLIGKKVVEIGCGKGEYMTPMESTGAVVSGIEHLASSVEVAKKNGHSVMQGFIENSDTKIENSPYDGFIIMNFLEHIPNPSDFLMGIGSNLSEEGVGIVEVPNFDMMIRKSLYSEFIQDHLSYFTKDSLVGLLMRSGFEVISCKEIWHGYILSAEVKKRKAFDAGAFVDKHNELKKEVHDFLNGQQAAGKTIAVWGAGHQALANLSLLNMTEYIECVLDSADFKQNKYTPATHLPVVSPIVLREGKIDTVIVMAGSYSEEIKNIISRDYPWVYAVILGENGLEV
ncbi:class I SAM-dependent methyltransferase [Butyrivibrio sp. AD3002]|uniref:class I SAM-dependent methyltransferase n=1 Tax=Butyrivibrio sp. AD3002 TaxID=1280670 RepID=UPI0003B5AC5F|nr:class I SAM-dependent methyltransferase [Butyrivibrio sp. AD3002]